MKKNTLISAIAIICNSCQYFFSNNTLPSHTSPPPSHTSPPLPTPLHPLPTPLHPLPTPHNPLPTPCHLPMFRHLTATEQIVVLFPLINCVYIHLLCSLSAVYIDLLNYGINSSKFPFNGLCDHKRRNSHFGSRLLT